MPGESYRVCTACGQQARVPAGNEGEVAGVPTCRNSWCVTPDRPLDAVFSIGNYNGSFRRAIVAYKYRADLRWARLFGRLLYGFLVGHANWFEEYGVICPVPSYPAGARRPWGHVELFCAELGRLAGAEWPVQPLVTKSLETEPMSAKAHPMRRQIARTKLSGAFVVVAPIDVVAARVIVVDDVCASGETLLAVARACAKRVAADVSGLVLARASWHPRRSVAAAAQDGDDRAPPRAVIS